MYKELQAGIAKQFSKKVLSQPPLKIEERPNKKTSIALSFEMFGYELLNSLHIQKMINTSMIIKYLFAHVIKTLPFEP